MTVSRFSQGSGGRLLAVVASAGMAATLACAQPPAALPPPAAPPPPPASEAPVWLRPTDEILERPEVGREDEIETDRDSFTPAVSTAGRGRFIVESAYTFLDNRRVPETHSLPEFLVRYGATERIELRLGWNYEVGGAGNTASGSTVADDFEGATVKREYTLSYGFKAQLTKQDGWLPASVVILQGRTPTGGEATDTHVVATGAWGWELPNRWKLDGAFRYASGSEEADRFDIVAPSAVLKVPVGEKVNVHAEYFGLFSRNKEHDFVVHYVSPGVHYLITPDLEVGVRLGWGLNDQSARFFSNVGLGWRF